MRKRLLWVVAIAASIGVLTVPGASAQSTASPFDSPTVYCTSSSAPSGPRNSGYGVTKDSIILADDSVDLALLSSVTCYHQALPAGGAHRGGRFLELSERAAGDGDIAPCWALKEQPQGRPTCGAGASGESPGKSGCCFSQARL